MQKKHTPRNFDFKLRKKIGHLKPHFLAKKIGLSTRLYRKCNVVDLLLGHWKLISLGQYSYDNWATQISSITGRLISGQAICKRMTNQTITFLQELLNKSMLQKYDNILKPSLFASFNEVYIQDATHFSLPRSLAQYFPGSFSKYGKSATAKVQATVSLKKGVFRDIKLFSFRDNDQKDSSRIIASLQTNDLVIRDLGYFVLASFIKIKAKNAFFLSRLRYGVNVYDIKKGTKLDLMKILQKKQTLDLDVFLGKQKNLKCRLVVVKLPDNVANERRRKAKSNRNKSANHSKEYYLQLGYSMYITNVSSDIWTIDDVIESYKARWYIEIVFKAWKSHLKMKVIIPKAHINKQRVEFYLYSSLLFVNLIVMPVFRLAQKAGSSNNAFISILKLAAYINQNINLFISNQIATTFESINYFCTYETRRSRTNAIESMYSNSC